jgi:hypothetical protein
MTVPVDRMKAIQADFLAEVREREGSWRFFSHRRAGGISSLIFALTRPTPKNTHFHRPKPAWKAGRPR